MATITHMRQVFLHNTGQFWYIVPCELKFKFFDLMKKYYDTKSEEDRKTFLDAFGEYRLREDYLGLQELYVKERGIFHRANDHK